MMIFYGVLGLSCKRSTGELGSGQISLIDPR